MNNTYTNYTIVNKGDNADLLATPLFDRDEAREALALVKAQDFDAKIQANEYTLKSTKFIR